MWVGGSCVVRQTYRGSRMLGIIFGAWLTPDFHNTTTLGILNHFYPACLEAFFAGYPGMGSSAPAPMRLPSLQPMLRTVPLQTRDIGSGEEEEEEE